MKIVMAERRKQVVLCACALVVLSFRVGLAVAASGPQPWRPGLPTIYVGKPAGADFTPWQPAQEQNQDERSGTGNPAWKQVTAYGLEFLGAGVTSSVVALGVYTHIWDVQGEPKFSVEAAQAVVGNALLTSTCAWGVGRLMGQRTTWWHAVVGTAIGSLVAIPLVARLSETPVSSTPAWTAAIALPALGAVAGLNWWPK